MWHEYTHNPMKWEVFFQWLHKGLQPLHWLNVHIINAHLKCPWDSCALWSSEAGEPTAVRDCQDWQGGEKGVRQRGRGGDAACWFRLVFRMSWVRYEEQLRGGRGWEDNYARAQKQKGKEKKANNNVRKRKGRSRKKWHVVLTHNIYVTRASWSHEGVYRHAGRTQCELQLSRANRCENIHWTSDSLITRFYIFVSGQPS